MLRGLVHSRQLLAHHFETSLTSLFPLSFLLPCFLLLRLHLTDYELFISFISLLVCQWLSMKLPSWLANKILDHSGSCLDEKRLIKINKDNKSLLLLFVFSPSVDWQ